MKVLNKQDPDLHVYTVSLTEDEMQQVTKALATATDPPQDQAVIDQYDTKLSAQQKEEAWVAFDDLLKQ